MSTDFPNINIDQLVRPIRNTPSSLLNRAYVPPRSLVAFLDWAADYGAGTAKPNVNVLVNVQAGGAQAPIDFIRSVKIDNTGNAAPVYVEFLDTTDTIVAPPNTIVWEPVVTNSKVANVIMLGASGVVGKTRVYFCNFFVPPYANPEVAQALALWRASQVITNGSNIFNTNFGVPSLGDNSILISKACVNGSASTPLVFNASNTSRIFITSMQAFLAVSNGTTPASNQAAKMIISYGGSRPTVWQWSWVDSVTVYDKQFGNASGFNLEFINTGTLGLNYTGPTLAAAEFSLNISYTSAPPL